MKRKNPPEAFHRFRDRFPEVFQAYEALGGAAHASGPMDARTRQLVKLALAVGNQQEGGVRAHARRAVEAGVTQQEMLQIVALSITSIGFAPSVAAFTWIADEIALK